MIHLLFVFSLDLLPEEIFGTEEIPEHILSDSSAEEEEDVMSEQKSNHQLRRRIRHLEHNLRDITARCSAERERLMSLEALVGGKIMFKFQISLSTRTCSLSSDVSERYNNLKASWDSLMEAASHGNPRSFYVAITMVLE
jgi:hypothetical protein